MEVKGDVSNKMNNKWKEKKNVEVSGNMVKLEIKRDVSHFILSESKGRCF